jgi:hypothetical protein
MDFGMLDQNVQMHVALMAVVEATICVSVTGTSWQMTARREFVPLDWLMVKTAFICCIYRCLLLM